MRPVASLLSKIAPRDELPGLLAPLRPGRKVVFTNGCFDLLHPGHVDLLARARALGDILVLGLNSDASVRGLKGPTRPVVPFEDRALVLAGLASVDFVTMFDEPTPLALIEAVLPDVLVKGGDWPVASIVGREAVEAAGGTVKSLPLLPGFSTTVLIERIKSL
ncbi:D-glycero-beta-D-manno-heptose 1-phosphate adenylyltransferase [Fundidesulfovibrio terrae]|uniref:D-glycero-beta-D-manno-heptose 1-phosphate adenylyltransferase n=1 Tax=Fundidesulfovibrio terrae TaxID=2922866 RepID=UPI001FAFAA38|nr:D-glycero-beta-D-manno-heptose 1-phosphate adenylyltransferase [Fundidesulfovibrio terrae]